MSRNTVTGSSAIFGDNGEYRYRLQRNFARGVGTCLFVMLNPSTADSELNDPTIRRCIDYAMVWGNSRLIVVNIFALRSTDPKVLYKHPDPVGRLNNYHIDKAAAEATTIICAWGAHGKLYRRGRDVLYLLEARRPQHLGLTKGLQPKHPLYLKADLKPMHFAEGTENGTG